LDNELVLDGDQLVGAFAFVVDPVSGRALLLGGKLGFELLDPRLGDFRLILGGQRCIEPWGLQPYCPSPLPRRCKMWPHRIRWAAQSLAVL
jgi:hypothetical protein